MPGVERIGIGSAADGHSSPIRTTARRPDGRTMDQITHLRLAGNDGVDGGSCRPGGCAGLCTEAGLRAADTAHRSRMLARARRVLADPELAEEAVQEALLRAWRSCSTFDPAGGPLLPWLLALPRNPAIALAGWRGRRPPVSAQADPTDAPV